MNPTPSPPDQTAAPPAPRRRAGWRAFAALALLSIGALLWLLVSAAGLRILADLATALSEQRLQLSEVEGRLIGPLQIGQIRWQQPGLQLQLDGLALDWAPARLLQREAQIHALSIGRLQVRTAPSTEPAATASAPPALPRLPFALQLARFSSGPIELAAEGDASSRIVDGLDAEGLGLDPAGLRIERLQARRDVLQLDAQVRWQPDGRLQARASVFNTSPFKGEARRGMGFPGALPPHPHPVPPLEGEGAVDRALHLQLHADGPLDALPLQGELRYGPARAELQAVLTPFAGVPLAGATLALQALELAELWPQAPQARLAGQLTLQPDQAGRLHGRLQLDNARPGRIDQQAVPLQSLLGQLDWTPERLQLQGLELRLPGQGRLSGQGEWRDGRLALQLHATELDPASLHRALHADRLAGPLRLALGPDAQQLQAELRGRLFQLHTDLQRDGEQLQIRQLDLSARAARLSAQGQAWLDEPPRLQLTARLQDVDPAALLAQAPPGRLQASLQLSARAGASPQLEARFELDGSRLAGESLAGGGQLRFKDDTLEQADLALRIGPNRLISRGGWGRAGQRLNLQIDAPRLAYGPLQGDLHGHLELAGSLTAPRVAGRLDSHRLSLPGAIELRELALDADLPADPQAPLKLDARLGWLGAAAKPWLQTLQLNLRGSRNAHRLELASQLPAPLGRLTLALEGGLQPKSVQPDWRGRLAELQLRPDYPALGLTLAEPAELRIDAQTLALGPAVLRAADWQLRLDALERQGQQWRSHGRLSSFAPAALGLGTLHGDLRLDGDWQLAWGGSLAGRIGVWRSAGDLRVGQGEGLIALGLQQLRLELQAAEQRLSLNLDARGERLGALNGQLALPLSNGAPDRTAPLDGLLTLELPDPGWLAPLLRPDSRLAGQLRGQLQIAGSLAQPRLQGGLNGQQLAFTDLATGLRLDDGQLALRFADDRVWLDALTFRAPRVPAPDELQQRLPADWRSGTGRLQLTGELDPLHGQGVFKLQLAQVGVLQQPERWLLLSGDTRIGLQGGVLEVGGQLEVDAAWLKLGAPDRPSLSDDVVIHRAGASPPEASRAMPLRLDLTARLGRHVLFSGAGLNSRLEGELRLQAEGLERLRATGTIRSVDGRFSAYGQQLEVRRGMVNFQGLLDNPGLNILAVRPGLAVEAGVQVAGTVRKPRITLVSDPDLPDAEKLSWLILGRGSDQTSGGEQALLLNAALSILGGDEDSGGLTRRLRQSFGLDELSLGQGSLNNPANLPASQVAGSGGHPGSAANATGQIVTLGKRLASNLYLSFEQALGGTGSVVKLTLQLSRHLSLIAQAGTDNALDAFYTLRFGR